jgi:hypothetical protein
LQVLLVWYIETIPNFFASIQNTDPEWSRWSWFLHFGQ